jgi:hypothetical protein
MVGEVMAYALLHAASPKLATVVALGDRDRPHVVLARDVPETNFGNIKRAPVWVATPHGRSKK